MRVTEAVSDDDRVISAAVIDHIRTHRMSESTLAVAVGTRLGITYVSVLPVIDDLLREGVLIRLDNGHVARASEEPPEYAIGDDDDGEIPEPPLYHPAYDEVMFVHGLLANGPLDERELLSQIADSLSCPADHAGRLVAWMRDRGNLTRDPAGRIKLAIVLNAVHGAMPDLPDGFPEPAPIRLPTPDGSHISNISVTLEQDGDTWQPGSDGQYLRLSVPPAEDDQHYAVLRTKRWAINDGGELRALADLVDAVIGMVGR